MPGREGDEIKTLYKVCDFGLSRVLGKEELAGTHDAPASTEEEEEEGARSDMIMTGKIGTSIFMSPEMIANDKQQLAAHPFASDVFSYGILAWQVCCLCVWSARLKLDVAGPCK